MTRHLSRVPPSAGSASLAVEDATWCGSFDTNAELVEAAADCDCVKCLGAAMRYGALARHRLSVLT